VSSSPGSARILPGSRLLGDDTIPVELEATTTWTMNEIHATTLRSGRVFAMGDAVHRHPPMNGLGSNTALQDAFNLAWKLALVLAGQAGEALLDSYDAERQPVAEALVTKTMGNMALFGQIATALGLTRHAQDQAEMDALVAAFEAPTTAGMLRRREFREAMAALVYGFSAVGGEFNLRYVSGAVVPDDVNLTVEDPELQVILGAAKRASAPARVADRTAAAGVLSRPVRRGSVHAADRAGRAGVAGCGAAGLASPRPADHCPCRRAPAAVR
jgi:FAD binding domain